MGIYILIFGLLLILQIAYLQFADRYNIIDKPNERSSHKSITILGGGIVFPLAALAWFAFYGFQIPLFIAGLLSITIISFGDDLLNLSRRLRSLVHLFAVSLLFAQAYLFDMPWFVLPIAFILVIGWLNAFNFMDGINGMTALYSLTALLTMLWLNKTIIFTSNDLLTLIILSVIIFSFFNVRKKAKCFAGDVGSITMAFLLAWFMIRLMTKTGHLEYIFLFSVYAIDSVITIFYRLINGENIFQAHRSHLYQFLSNEFHWPHLVVSALYATIQFILNIGLIVTMEYFPQFSATYVIVGFIALSILYIETKSSLRGKIQTYALSNTYEKKNIKNALHDSM